MSSVLLPPASAADHLASHAASYTMCIVATSSSQQTRTACRRVLCHMRVCVMAPSCLVLLLLLPYTGPFLLPGAALASYAYSADKPLYSYSPKALLRLLLAA